MRGAIGPSMAARLREDGGTKRLSAVAVAF